MENICKNCGSKVEQGSTFCYTCGAKVEISIESTLQNIESTPNENSFKKIKHFGLNQLGKVKESTSNISKSTKDFVEGAGYSIANNFKSDGNEIHFKKYSYEESLDYIYKNHSTKIAFPASDSETEDKLKKLLSGEVIGAGAGLVGAAASIGLIGTTLGAGLIIVGAGAFIGGIINSNYEKMSWVLADLLINDNELIISGKFSLGFDEIKHISTKIHGENELVVLTLKDQAIEFKTYNANALKTVLVEKKNNHLYK
ncbi:zinc ribbon domain-containing protein [Methanobrevibacter sp.]|uniref:zinc ribbon domain-containing protein n=1 Tax=Methanobrevibacter sp. TaxID=66852 RepID=UPI0025F9491E|nr:zinc ribbon domain-containing protein [Methanobrevibacter sp.]MBR4446889.1 zinc ribbon domain-containing protein [Methanobrevibacter sp.]